MTENRKGILDALDDKPSDDLPDFSTDEWAEKIAAAPVRRGRPPLTNPKKPVTIRLDADLIAVYKAQGKGWQGRMNDDLRKLKGL